MFRSKTTLFLVALMIVVAVPSGAAAGPPGEWTRISDARYRQNWQVAQLRTSDGVLHVVWRRENSNNEDRFDMLHTPILPDGSDLAPTIVEENWTGFGNPDLVTTPDGLGLFFGGLRSNQQDPQNNLNASFAEILGDAWTLTPGTIASGDTARENDVGATQADNAEMTPFQSWGGTDGVFVHRGLDPSSLTHNFQDLLGPDQCCGYSPDLAVDGAGGDLWVSWYSDAKNLTGVWVGEVDPATGAPIGEPIKLPDSIGDDTRSAEQIWVGGRTPITGRPDQEGVFIAFSTGVPESKTVRLWSGVGGTFDQGMVLAQGGVELGEPAIAVDPDGRIWVAWWEDRSFGRDVRIVVRRSNLDVTRFGKAVKIDATSDVNYLWELDINAQDGVLDILANLDKASGKALWHTQAYAGLTLTAKPSKFAKNTKKTVTFTVLDAEDPVAGAVVTIAGKSKTTDEAGRVKIPLGPYSSKRNLAAKATLDGYTPGTTTVKVTN